MAAWEYLDEPAFQTRFGVVAAYLRGRTQNKVIVDLNCGHNAGLLRYLPSPVRYIGNDVLIDPSVVLGPVSDWLLDIKDSKMLGWLKQNVGTVDIFLHLGYGGRDLSGEEAESATELDSGIAIVSHFKPELIILESVRKFMEYMRAQYENCIEDDYQIRDTIRLNIFTAGHDFVGEREFYFYERSAA